MKYIDINSLEATTVANDDSCIPIDNGSHTYKIKVSDFESGANATAKSYAEKAASSATESANQASAASTSAKAAADSLSASKLETENAKTYMENSLQYASNSEGYANTSKEYASKSSGYSDTSKSYSNTANTNALMAKSYAEGGTGLRDGEDTNNAKYYSQIAGAIAAGGVIAFNTRKGDVIPQVGDYTAEQITRGNSNVDSDITANTNAIAANASEITKKVSLDGGDTKDTVVGYTSSDVADGSATAWTSVPALASGEKHSAILGKVSQMFKNVRYLWKMLGSTDISKIGDGTATGAIASLNADLAKQETQIINNTSQISSNASAISTLNSDLTKKATYYQIITTTNLWTNETYNAIRAQIVESGATRIDGIGIFNGYTSAYSVAARSDYKYVGILFFSYSDYLTIVNTSDSGNSWITKNIVGSS